MSLKGKAAAIGIGELKPVKEPGDLTALGLMGARARAIGDPRRALALMTGAFGVGQIMGPIFAGFVSDRLGSFTASSIVAALGLLAAALLAAA